MKGSIRYILPLAIAALSLSACHKGPEMIPPKAMAEVYADMFVADQWIFDHEVKYMTDTTAVYEPIFEKHGYDLEDFRYSVDRYMNDAEGLMDVLEDTKYILQCKLKEIDERRILKNKQDSIRLAKQKNAIQISLLELEGAEKDSLLKKFFPMFPVDSICIPGIKDEVEAEVEDSSSMERSPYSLKKLDLPDLKDVIEK